MASAAGVTSGGSMSAGMTSSSAVSTTAMAATTTALGLEFESCHRPDEDCQKQLNKVLEFERCRHQFAQISMCNLA